MPELKSDDARFTTLVQTRLFEDRFDVGAKTRNIAIQLILQQCCVTSCTFFVARLTVP